MKPLLLLIIFCGLTSCDKVRDIVGRFSRKPAAPEAPAIPDSGPVVTSLTQGGYDPFRSQSGKVVVIDFHADRCGSCRELGPILEKIASEQSGRILIGKINVDQNRELAAKEGVEEIPDVRIFRDTREVDRFVGLPPESEVRRRLESHLPGLPEPAPAAGEAKPADPQPITQPASKDRLPPSIQRR